MTHDTAIHIDSLSYRYGDRWAVSDVSFGVEPGEIFTLLGPNGSGKTTLFRVLSTLIPPQVGNVRILGHDPRHSPAPIQLGVVFQSPSLDKKLTALENLRHHGRLYGLRGSELVSQSNRLLAQVGLEDRAADLVETLSGGLRRRVELAQAMLHRPRLLILDEPSTGLDPNARADLWRYLQQVRREDGVTVVLTTHLLEEADRADRIAILHEGKLAALDTPTALRQTVGGDAITIHTAQAAELAVDIGRQFDCQPTVVDGTVRFEQPDGHQWIARLMETFGDRIESITLGKPTLEDVFIDATGHRF